MATIAITGASGFLGSALQTHLRAQGHVVRRLQRGAAASAGDAIAWDPATGAVDRDAAAALDVVVHLAGENLAAGRWTAARRRAIETSRGPLTERLCRALAALPRPPALLAASAVGIYGDRGDEVLDDASATGTGFLAEVCQAWERAAEPLRACGARVAHLRLGLVLGRGGVLARMLPAFRLGLGGPLGNGRHYMSWIALADLLAIVELLAVHEKATGPFLCVAPDPVTNRTFARALGRALHRPAFLPVPRFALRLLLGDLTDEALLASQRALPSRLLQFGYHFRHADLGSGLRAALA